MMLIRASVVIFLWNIYLLITIGFKSYEDFFKIFVHTKLYAYRYTCTYQGELTAYKYNLLVLP